MDKRIDYQKIENSFGCDNCEHKNDGCWDDYCRICNPDYIPPSEYRPARRTIQEKVYYDKLNEITYGEYLEFINNEKY